MAFEKTVEIHTGHVIPQLFATEAIATYIQSSQSYKGDASQLKATSYTLLTVPMPPG